MLVLVLFMAPSPLVRAVGALVGGEDQAPTVLRERGLVVWEADRVTVSYELVLSGAAGPVAWLVPMPAGVQPGEIDPDAMEAIEAFSAPHVALITSREAAAGCADPVRTSTTVAEGAPEPWPTGDPIQVDVGVLATGGVPAVLAWLADEGLTAPADLEADLQSYLDDGMDVAWARAELGDGEMALLGPMVLTMPRPPDGRLRHPLGLASSNGAEGRSSELYVLADKRYRAENHPAMDVDALGVEMARRHEAGLDADYMATLTSLAAAAAGGLFVTEYAADLTGRALPEALASLAGDQSPFLTRLHGYLEPTSLVDTVIGFAKDGPEVESEVTVDLGSTPAALGLVLAFLALALRLGRGRHPSPDAPPTEKQRKGPRQGA